MVHIFMHVNNSQLWLGSFTCHCSNMGVERTPNKSQHRTLTLEKKILTPLLPGIKPVTFWSWIWCSTNHSRIYNCILQPHYINRKERKRWASYVDLCLVPQWSSHVPQHTSERRPWWWSSALCMSNLARERRRKYSQQSFNSAWVCWCMCVCAWWNGHQIRVSTER